MENHKIKFLWKNISKTDYPYNQNILLMYFFTNIILIMQKINSLRKVECHFTF